MVPGTIVKKQGVPGTKNILFNLRPICKNINLTVSYVFYSLFVLMKSLKLTDYSKLIFLICATAASGVEETGKHFFHPGGKIWVCVADNLHIRDTFPN